MSTSPMASATPSPNRDGAKWVRTGAVFALIGVALGAFGAHALQESLHVAPRWLDVWRTGVQYHLIHALALVLVGLLASCRVISPGRAKGMGMVFAVGILLFSGSLYALALSSLRGAGPILVLGAVTPLGGVCFLAGWGMLAFGRLGEEKRHS